MASRLYRFLALAALAFWTGGTTFYALIVVPTGTRVFSGTEQGFLTEQVTRQLNWTGVASLIILIPALRKSRSYAAIWLVLSATIAALFALHPKIAAHLNHADRSVTDYASFYAWHRVYLLVTAIQWLAGLAMLWLLISPSSSAKAQSGPQPYDIRKKNMAC